MEWLMQLRFYEIIKKKKKKKKKLKALADTLADIPVSFLLLID